MNDQDKKDPQSTNNDPATPQEQQASAENLSPDPSAEPELKLERPDDPVTDPLEVLREENAALKDKLVRTLADMENLRSRTEREKADMAKYANANFARDILTIGDNITRAMDAVPEGAANADPALKTFIEGVEMTNRELQNTLERHGVKPIDAKGQPFDPNLHQAMFEVPNPEVNAGLVVEVVQAGYMIGDRVLRPAGVGVSKGGAKLPKEQPAPDASAEQTQSNDNNPGSSAEQKAATDEAGSTNQTPQPDQPQSASNPNVGEKVDKSA